MPLSHVPTTSNHFSQQLIRRNGIALKQSYATSPNQSWLSKSENKDRMIYK